MIDLTQQHLPPQSLLYEKSTKNYLTIAGFDLDNDYYCVVNVQPYPVSLDKLPFAAIPRVTIHRQIEQGKLLLLNVYMHVEGRLEFRRMSETVFEDLVPRKALRTLLMGWRWKGTDGSASCFWADEGEQMALFMLDQKTWLPFYKRTSVISLPYRSVLMGMIPSPPGWKHARTPQPDPRRPAGPEPTSSIHGQGDSSGQPVSDANREAP